jgi:hypothetical protein
LDKAIVMSNSCKAITASGEQCKLKAAASGYCHLHDPDKIAERAAAKKAAEEAQQQSWNKGKALREVLEIVKTTCNLKGWKAYISNQDRKNWRYASVSVERSVKSGYTYETITGVFDISLNGGVILSANKTSFHSYGLQDLQNAIMAELEKLPWLESRRKKSPINTHTSFHLLKNTLRRFHIVVKQLGYRYDNRPTLIINDEYDVQDLLHALLKAIFDDVREEDAVPNYAGSASRVDFLLKNEKIVVEAKVATSRLRDKKIGEQLIVDIKRYQSHPDCEKLVCFVYDPDNYIKNPIALENDLSGKHDKLEVLVLVVPH